MSGKVARADAAAKSAQLSSQWVNTLVLLAAVIVGLYQVRKIAEALARVEETAARSEKPPPAMSG